MKSIKKQTTPRYLRDVRPFIILAHRCLRDGPTRTFAPNICASPDRQGYPFHPAFESPFSLLTISTLNNRVDKVSVPGYAHEGNFTGNVKDAPPIRLPTQTLSAPI